MQIKITPLTTAQSHLEGEYGAGNNYYFASSQGAGIVTEVIEGDDWLESELAWVTRSEIPFVTAIRHAQLFDAQIAKEPVVPIVRRTGPCFVLRSVNKFPSSDACKQLIVEFCRSVHSDEYTVYQGDIAKQAIQTLYDSFDIDDDLLIRSGSCLYKAYLLFNTSWLFSEEIYINIFIAFEAIIEYQQKIHDQKSRKAIVTLIGKSLKQQFPAMDFAEYEEEMRDSIRNNIIHPIRRSGETNAQPFLMADYVFEDLEMVDWLFKQTLEVPL